eukprot:1716087-Alexandrium_andersonii.AAC.1
MALFLETQPAEIQQRARSIVHHHLELERLQEQFSFDPLVKLGTMPSEDVPRGKRLARHEDF